VTRAEQDEPKAMVVQEESAPRVEQDGLKARVELTQVSRDVKTSRAATAEKIPQETMAA